MVFDFVPAVVPVPFCVCSWIVQSFHKNPSALPRSTEPPTGTDPARAPGLDPRVQKLRHSFKSRPTKSPSNRAFWALQRDYRSFARVQPTFKQRAPSGYFIFHVMSNSGSYRVSFEGIVDLGRVLVFLWNDCMETVLWRVIKETLQSLGRLGSSAATGCIGRHSRPYGPVRTPAQRASRPCQNFIQSQQEDSIIPGLRSTAREVPGGLSPTTHLVA